MEINEHQFKKNLYNAIVKIKFLESISVFDEDYDKEELYSYANRMYNTNPLFAKHVDVYITNILDALNNSSNQ